MREIRYAVRSLLKAPAVTFAAWLILSLGVGVTTAIFTVANAVLFRPLPFADPDRLVQIGTVGVLELQAYREHGESIVALASYSGVNKDLHGAGEPERVAAVSAEPGLFDILGVQPLAGRTFRGGDPPTVAVLSERFWRQRFNAQAPGDWKIVLDGEPYSVLGVMPDRFRFPYRAQPTDLWIPTELARTENRFQRIDVAIGRLRAGATMDAAGAEWLAIAGRLGLRSPSSPGGPLPITALGEAVVGRSRRTLMTLLGAAVLVLLSACASVANLLLARAESRKREVAVRAALGAGRGRLFQQFLIESLVLVCAAAAGAAAIAFVTTRLLIVRAGSVLPRSSEVGFDGSTFLFLVMVASGTGVVLGLVPALSALKEDVAGALNTFGSRTSRSRGAAAIHNGLVITEVALAFILLTGAGLLLRAFVSLQRAPTGIVADRVITLRIDARGQVRPEASPTAVDAASSAQGRYFRAIEERVRQLPGVEAAGFVTRLHLQSPGNTGQVSIAGRAVPVDGPSVVRLREASPGYFRALGVPLRAGRLFGDRDPGIVINEAFARAFFGDENPLGRVSNRGTIIGIVGDVRQSLRAPAEPEMYGAIAGTSYSAATLVVSARVPAETLAAPLRAAVREISPNQTVFDVRTMGDVIGLAYADVDMSLWLAGLFAGLAVALSVAGIYAVLSSTVAARRKEFGIRLALGADRMRLLRMVAAQGGRLIAAGGIIGIAGALALTRFLQSLLYEVAPTDPITFVAASVLLVGIALMACVNPARRAMAVDPMSVLRRD
jgi:predicted permease